MNTTEIGESIGEIFYRFPQARTGIEILTSTQSSFDVRVVWYRGKTMVPHFESTPLRPIAEVVFGGQTLPLFLSQHQRRSREKVLLEGRRKTTTSERATLRAQVMVEGREDRLTWHWRFSATAPAMAAARHAAAEVPTQICLNLPYALGNARILTVPGPCAGAGIWMNDVVATVVPLPTEEGAAAPVFAWGERALTLTLIGADLAGNGVSLGWETHLTPARTEEEAYHALRRHLSQAVDRRQMTSVFVVGLLPLSESAETTLSAPQQMVKRGMDRWAYRLTSSEHHGSGAETETAQAVCALLARHLITGDDALKRTARMLAYGISEFQVSDTESPHWGAIWDRRTGSDTYTDHRGDAVLSLATAARTTQALYQANRHLDAEQLARVAQAAAQWTLLRTERSGFSLAERFEAAGPPLPDGSPWVTSEAIRAWVETFRTTRNETYIKASVRSVNAFQEQILSGALAPESASTEHLAAFIEGILATSGEYESEEMVTLALRLGEALKGRRLPDGSLLPYGEGTVLRASLAAARAALALTRVDKSHEWLLLALRAVQFAKDAAENERANGNTIPLADTTGLCLLPLHLLLCVATRTKKTEIDLPALTVKKGWQTFAPDHNTRDYISVTTTEGEPIDHLALVCPVSLQVLIPVIAPAPVTEVILQKNQRVPYVKNLITQAYDQKAELSPLGDGAFARIGIFLADT